MADGTTKPICEVEAAIGCCAYLQGLESGLGTQVLDDFAGWLREKGDMRPELAWPSLVLAIALG